MWTSIVQTTDHRKLMVHFENMKCTSGFCFVSCYCIILRGKLKEAAMEYKSHVHCGCTCDPSGLQLGC